MWVFSSRVANGSSFFSPYPMTSHKGDFPSLLRAMRRKDREESISLSLPFHWVRWSEGKRAGIWAPLMYLRPLL